MIGRVIVKDKVLGWLNSRLVGGLVDGLGRRRFPARPPLNQISDFGLGICVSRARGMGAGKR